MKALFAVGAWWVYAIIAAALVAFGFGGGWTVNGWRLGAQVATLEGRLGVCNANVQHLGEVIGTVNLAVEKQGKDSAAALAKGRQARAAAEAGRVAADAERARLEALLAARKGTTCGDARRDIGGKP